MALTPQQKEYRERRKKVLQAFNEVLGGSLDIKGKAKTAISGTLESVGGTGAVAAATGVGVAVLAAVKGFEVLKGSVDGFLDEAIKTVGKFQPGAMKQFQYVMDDVQATIGQSLLPVLQLMTKGWRLVGDVLETILPSTDDVRKALEPLSDMFDTLRQALAGIVPIFKEVFVTGLQLLGDGLKYAAVAFRTVLASLGLLTGAKLGNSVGAAARNIQFGQAEQFAKQSYQAAYQSGAAKGRPVQNVGISLEKLLDKVGPILDFVTEINILIDKFIVPPMKAAGEAADTVKDWIAKHT